MTTHDLLTEELLASLDASVDDVARAATLPSELYTSPAFLDFEREALFMREWLAVGRAERIPEPGDWFTVDLMGEPVVVVRDEEGEVRALSADRKSTRLNSSHSQQSRMPSSA